MSIWVMARIISVTNHKGGVGKTTIVANLGFALARQFKVLLIDFDPQANLSSGLGFKDADNTIGRYLQEVIHVRYPTVVPHEINQYVHIIPCKVDLLDIENRLRNTISGDLMLKRIIVTIQKDYDLILIDCPPAFNYLTINALSSSNLVLVPAKPELFSIQGIELIKDYAERKQIPYKIIFNQVDMRSNYHRQVINTAQENYQSNLVANYIRTSISLAEAFEQAIDIFKFNESGNGSKDFIKLADELIPFV